MSLWRDKDQTKCGLPEGRLSMNGHCIVFDGLTASTTLSHSLRPAFRSWSQTNTHNKASASASIAEASPAMLNWLRDHSQARLQLANPSQKLSASVNDWGRLIHHLIERPVDLSDIQSLAGFAFLETEASLRPYIGIPACKSLITFAAVPISRRLEEERRGLDHSRLWVIGNAAFGAENVNRMN